MQLLCLELSGFFRCAAIDDLLGAHIATAVVAAAMLVLVE